jgi:magnesium chelatase subunit D
MSARLPQTMNSEDHDDPAERLLTALVCSTLEPALSGVLLFDLPPDHLSAVTAVFTGLLGRAAGHPPGTTVPRTTLNAAVIDEDLWLRPRVRRGPHGIEFAVEPGPLIEAGTGPSLVVVPDLARLSVPGMRAAVQLLGADTATVEDSGLRRQWRPRARWLAVCRAEDIELISPHVLDRFPVRLAVPGLCLRPGSDPLGPLPTPWATALDPAVPRPPTRLDGEVAPRVLELLDDRDGIGHRRSLALARIARALARLDDAGQSTAGHRTATGAHVTADHVDRAARLIRLRTVHRPAAPPEPGPEPAVPDIPEPRPDHPFPEPHPAQGGHTPPGTPIHESGPATPIGPAPVPGDRTPVCPPYPEDTAGPRPEGTALHTPARRTAGTRTARGAVVGVRRARDLWDLAPVRTAMEAAKYRAVRDGQERLVIAPQDLRGYVRAPEPVRMLTLVLDHTCHEDWDWHETLDPFLQWAYVTRASVHVVEVGGRDATRELRADSFAARSTRDPRIAAALSRRPGRATPLAHGLDQAGHALRRAFQHHRAGLVEALLVVVTDGRGNVPLAASHRDRPAGGPVGRVGIEDALAAAGRIGSMGRTQLHCVVVDPRHQPYTGLPADLADALHGSVVPGRPEEAAVNRAR